MAITIRDVAAKAGVTKAVVSAVLNERQTTVRVAEETRRRVRQAAQELNYRPNALARGLARKRTDTIGVIPQWPVYLSVWSGFTGEMMQGIARAAIRESYGVYLDFQKVDPEQLVASVTDGRIDGALLWRFPADLMAERLLEQDFPAVMMFGPHDNPDVWYVDCDNRLGGRMATEYLLRLGHTRILHLTGSQGERFLEDRCLGYQDALRAAGVPLRPEWIVDVGWEPDGDSLFAQIKALLDAPDRPTAVFAWYDGAAIKMLQKAREWGMRVPEDLSVIGFDSTAQCLLTTPTLTSIRQPIQEIADLAATMLIQRIRGEEVFQTHHLFAPTLDERGSCMPLHC
ncbi:MAG TPA: LacI family DNA-binding transcriptional regulator [Chthonomonadaceae bacterium]|nr:LacI family DNA-binding transcriptional regulator [Chthonomonadaceae bacterium]